MKPFAIFRIGTHTSSNGLTANFTEIDLEKSAKAYDPSRHEAPLVIGHPKDNSPAQGWVTSVRLVDQTLIANPKQIDPVFEEAVKAGRYKKRSASFYLPDSPNNPIPGILYLRHVGFVAIPAVKGMPDPEFKEMEEGVITFFEQESDVVPKEEGKKNPNSLDFAEEKLQFAEEKRKFELRERRFNALQWLDPLAVKGQLSDTEVEGFAQFFAHLGGNTFEISFGEGEEQTKENSLSFLQGFLESLPSRIVYNEIVTGQEKSVSFSDEEMSDLINSYRDKVKRKSGKTISYTEAVMISKKNPEILAK